MNFGLRRLAVAISLYALSFTALGFAAEPPGAFCSNRASSSVRPVEQGVRPSNNHLPRAIRYEHSFVTKLALVRRSAIR